MWGPFIRIFGALVFKTEFWNLIERIRGLISQAYLLPRI
jgi:hypothetical protein